MYVCMVVCGWGYLEATDPEFSVTCVALDQKECFITHRNQPEPSIKTLYLATTDTLYSMGIENL